jgi:ABC-type dipeptide/oligopeptide/nickel transport system permease subunit
MNNHAPQEKVVSSTSFVRRQRIKAWWRSFLAAWKIFRRNRLAMLGLFMIILYGLGSIAHPILMKTIWLRSVYDPAVGFDMKIFINPSPPSPGHVFGTDALGRDVLSMLLAAATPTFQLAIVAALTTAVIGLGAGAFSAYYRGWVDSIFTHLADLAMLAPAPLVMVVIGYTLNISPVKFGIIYGLLNGFGAVSVVMRSHALTLVIKPYIDASRVAGGQGPHIIWKHLIPHMLPLVLVNMMVTVTGAIFADGFVAFMGLSRARLNWGSMIYDSFTYRSVNTTIPWNVLIPSALAISFFAASFYLIARGLHEVADPRLREN